MPKVTTSKRFVELLKRSELVSSDKVASFLDRISPQSLELFSAEPTVLARHLVDAGLVSNWQVEQLMNGKYRGFRLGKYTLRDHLGTGGMSSVYLSEHPIMRRPVAIKVLPKSRVAKSSYLERFELEARAVAALDHPNIVRAYDIDNEGDTHYIVMEYVEGLDLQRMVDANGPFDFELAANYIAQAAAGLQHAHDSGVIHRDVKPANCLVDSTETVKVLDMGLVKFSREEHSLSSVYKDSVVGTADYLAPEQAVNSSRVDHRADIYGLGGTLYFILTGHPPFPEGSLTERLLKHQKEEPASIYNDRADAPATLVDICRRMMIKNPDDRIQTAATVNQELKQYLQGRSGSSSEPSSGLGRLSAFGQAVTGSRWQELIQSTPPTRPQKTSETSDTISASEGDTARIRSNEELALAPIEDDEDKNRISGTKSDILPDQDNLDVQVLSQIEEELGQSSSTSGSLIDLLEEPPSVSTSHVVLKRTHQSNARAWMFAVGAIIAVLVIGIALVSWLF